jgi:hypothetical protein
MVNTRNKLMVLIALSMAGCTTLPVLEEARPIQLYFDSPDLSACQFRGEVVGSQGSWYDFWLTPNPDLVNGAFNDIKNDALSKRANAVSIVPPIARKTFWSPFVRDPEPASKPFFR